MLFGRKTMNLSRLYPFFFCACVGAGAFAAKSAEISLVSGAFYGLLAGVAPMAALGIVYVGNMWWRPDLPPCQCGKTKYEEYKYIGPMEGFSGKPWYENSCPKCGRHYKSRGNVVVECDASGSFVPYMRISRWGRWERDNADPSAGGDGEDRAPQS